MQMQTRSHLEAHRRLVRRGGPWLLPLLALAWVLSAWVAPVVHELENHGAVRASADHVQASHLRADRAQSESAQSESAQSDHAQSDRTLADAGPGHVGHGHEDLPFDHDHHGDCLDCAFLTLGALAAPAPALPQPAAAVRPAGLASGHDPPGTRGLPSPRPRGPPQA